MISGEGLDGGERLCDVLFTVTDTHLDAELLVDMLCQMLGGIDATMLATGTAKAEHERCEAALDITAHMSIGQFIHAVEERQYLTIVLEEADDGFVETGQLLVRLVTARVMRRTAVEDIAAAIAALVLRNALGERETEDAHHQRTLCVVLRERGRTILRMGFVGIHLCGLVTIGTTG